MKTESFSLSDALISLLEKNGIIIATPIQKEIIPAIIAGRDVLAQSETGSGKTLSFALPIIEKINRNDGLKALILVPTRELCVQVTGEFSKFSHGKHLGIVPVYGGASINVQVTRLRTANILVATPGRLIDLLNRRVLRLDKIEYFVCDEADRMLDMGFIADIEKIVKLIPSKHQTLMFSATVTKEIEKLSKKYLNNPKHVKLASAVKPAFLRQTYYRTTTDKKMPLLISLLKKERHLALVFCNTKRITDKLARRLSVNGVNAKCLHGDMSQPQRERVTNEFRHQKFTVLVATDVAARGLHIEDISHVYNYDIPKDVESYTHRVGRTARAGKKGEAISIVASSEEQRFFKQILFTYRGSITLKEANDAELIPLIEAPSHRPRNETFKRETRGKEIRRSGTYKKDEQKKEYPPRERYRKDYRRREPFKKQSTEKELPHTENKKEKPPFPSSEIKPKHTWKKRWQDLIGGKEK